MAAFPATDENGGDSHMENKIQKMAVRLTEE